VKAVAQLAADRAYADDVQQEAALAARVAKADAQALSESDHLDAAAKAMERMTTGTAKDAATAALQARWFCVWNLVCWLTAV